MGDRHLGDNSGGQPSSGETPDSQSAQQKLHTVLAGIWERSKKTITERIEILKHAQGLVAEGRLDEGVRLSAVDAAHKLAGVLGTFGLPRGTELAREAEQIFERKEALSHEAGQRLGALVAELDSLMKKAGPSVRGDTV